MGLEGIKTTRFGSSLLTNFAFGIGLIVLLTGCPPGGGSSIAALQGRWEREFTVEENDSAYSERREVLIFSEGGYARDVFIEVFNEGQSAVITHSEEGVYETFVTEGVAYIYFPTSETTYVASSTEVEVFAEVIVGRDATAEELSSMRLDIQAFLAFLSFGCDDLTCARPFEVDDNILLWGDLVDGLANPGMFVRAL